MLTALTFLHLFIAVTLIVFVLLQDSKGDASGLMGGGGGGGGNGSVLGAAGASNFLAKATRFLAGMFAISCIALAYATTSSSGSSVIDAVPATELQRSAPADANKEQPLGGGAVTESKETEAAKTDDGKTKTFEKETLSQPEDTTPAAGETPNDPQ